MKLRKDKWETFAIGKVSSITSGYAFKSSQFKEIGIPVIKIKDIKPPFVSIGECDCIDESDFDEKKLSKYVLKKGDVLVAMTGATIGKVGKYVEDKIALLNQRVAKIDPIIGKSEREYLFHSISTEKFVKYSLGRGASTAQQNISSDVLGQYEIPLPPLEEQKQIAALFQSIETAMEQVDGQEKNLKALWKRLIDEFVSDKPSFGNLLKGKKLKSYNYCDVTEKLMRKIDPLTYGIERIVAGENLESEDFKIRTWQKVGEGYLGPAFHVLFKKGDILYGSRRTYLRKVSLANFDGVCANTTYVIRAKEDLLLQDLLKHIMLSERFTQYSIGVSKGSTNPYINWKDLDNFSFQVPDIESQKEIANVLDGILEIVEQLKQQKTTLKHLKQKLLNEILS